MPKAPDNIMAPAPHRDVDGNGSRFEAPTVTDRLAAIPGTELYERAIAYLRGEDNPFDAFVANDRPARGIAMYHVPDIHADVTDKIRLAIDKYRSVESQHRGQLQATRALVVRGTRGSGKTHLLHWMSRFDSQGREIWVCPRFYEGGYSFAEYLLRELLHTVLADDESRGPDWLRWCALEVTRRMLLESVGALAAHEWIEWVRGSSGWRVLCSNGIGRHVPDQRTVRADLEYCGPEFSFADWMTRRRIDRVTLRGLLAQHVALSETGTSIRARMRRAVLLALATRTLGQPTDPLADLIEQDFAESAGDLPPTRAALVDTLLETLVEILTAVDVPVVFAFDNMERLLQPRGSLDLPTAQAFLTGLAQVIDRIPGLLVLLLVETGLWNECLQQAVNSFAHDRLMLGIRLRGHGNIHQLDLQMPTLRQVESVARQRLATLHGRIRGGGQLPPEFPFLPEDFEWAVAQGSDVLRTVLMRLRDRYDERVLPEGQWAHRRSAEPASRPVETALPDAAQFARQILTPSWDRVVATKRAAIQGALRPARAGELHRALARWLELLAGAAVIGDWQLTGVDEPASFGDQPAFGILTVSRWQRIGGGGSQRVAIGPLLGERSSMPVDLRVKLAIFDLRPAPADELVVLWPRSGADQSHELPPATRKVWDQLQSGKPVRLLPVPTAEIAGLLGIPDWLDELDGQLSGRDRNAAQQFVQHRTVGLLERIAPT